MIAPIGFDETEEQYIARLEAEIARQAASHGSAGGEAETIDSVPSCGQENDYRRATPAPRSEVQSREAIAFELWQRFAPVHHIGWADETHRADYYAAADGVLGVLRPAQGSWMPIETAPKDGNPVLLLSKEYTDPADINGGPYHHPARCAIGRWHAEGTSWCDEHGRFPDNPEVDDDTINLHVTGVWFSGGGWFQPNEITHWMPLPGPALPSAHRGGPNG